MMKTLPITPKVKELTGTRKKDFRFYTTSEPICTNVYWDGGSRTEYEVLNMNTGRRFMPPPGSYPWTTPNRYAFQAGDLLIETGVYRGKPSSPCIGCRLEDETAASAYLGIQ